MKSTCGINTQTAIIRYKKSVTLVRNPFNNNASDFGICAWFASNGHILEDKILR